MKKLLTIMIISFLSITSFAQERFYNLYDGWTINKVHLYNNEYLTIGLNIHPTEQGNVPLFNTIDLNGDLLYTDSFTDSINGLTTYRARGTIMIEDTVYLAGSEVEYYKSHNLSRIIMKYNIVEAEMLSIKDYNHCYAGDGIIYLLDTTFDGFMLASIYEYNEYNSFPMLIFTNEIGDTLSTQKYEFLPIDPLRHRVYPYQLLSLPDGGYLLSCQDEFGSTPSGAKTVGACFLRLDNEGNELWRQYTATNDTICYHPFAFLLEGTDEYLISWSDPLLADFENSPYNPDLNSDRSIWLAKMTNAGVIYDKKKVSVDIPEFGNKIYYANDYSQDEDGYMYLMGEVTTTNSGFLLKINPEGEALWYREYECFPENDADLTYTKLYGLTPTSDGGFVMGGEYFSNAGSLFPAGTQQGLVIKVDSMGCLVEGCEYTNIAHTINAINAEIFPNPSSTEITILLPEKIENAHCKIYDVKGSLCIDIDIIPSENIHISFLPAGLYTINVWADDKLFTGKFVKE